MHYLYVKTFFSDEIKRNIKTDTYIIGQGDEEICTVSIIN